MIYMYIVLFYLLFHLPQSDLGLEHFSFSCSKIRTNSKRHLRVFNRDSLNIGLIVYLAAEGERAAKTVQCTY